MPEQISSITTLPNLITRIFVPRKAIYKKYSLGIYYCSKFSQPDFRREHEKRLSKEEKAKKRWSRRHKEEDIILRPRNTHNDRLEKHKGCGKSRPQIESLRVVRVEAAAVVG